MDGPEKLRFYLKEKKMKSTVLAQLLGVSRITVYQWMCYHSRPPLIMRYVLEYLTKGCGDVRPVDWLDSGEKEEIAASQRAIRRLRRCHPVEPLSARDQVRGRL